MSNTILDDILTAKRDHVARCKQQVSSANITARAAAEPPARGFERALRARVMSGHPAIIAEIKRASPSKGVIRADYQPAEHARSYAAAGATCLSVLTDEPFFQGSDDDLRAARAAVDLPVIRKDFIIDPYQIYEARALGADCILLIVAALDQPLLAELYQCAQDTGLDVLMEVHDDAELQRALLLEAPLIGVNNRNLKTFETSVKPTMDLKDHLPPGTLLVSESGISDLATVMRLRVHGVHAFLIGEALMREPDPGAALQALFPD